MIKHNLVSLFIVRTGMIFLSVRGYGKLQNVREKSRKGQGILRWMISGNPGIQSTKDYNKI